MNIFNKINKLLKGDKQSSVRIEAIKPFERNYEINTPTVWFTDSNIENCIDEVVKNKIEHIHLQTNTLDFLSDSRLKNVKGITVQFAQRNIAPLLKFKNITHLGLPKKIKVNFDFSKFPNLISLSGELPNKYENFGSLQKLKYTYLFSFRKPNFMDFSNCKNLIKILLQGLY